MLCDQFMKGAQEAGNQVEKINVASRKIGYCRACDYCRNHPGACSMKDDMTEILEQMLKADVIVMASPVYFYSIDAQMKALIDRSVARCLEFRDKEFYYIMTAAEDSDDVMDCTLGCFRGFAKCLEGSVEKGVIYGKGVFGKGEITSHPAMRQAYEMGLSVG